MARLGKRERMVAREKCLLNEVQAYRAALVPEERSLTPCSMEFLMPATTRRFPQRHNWEWDWKTARRIKNGGWTSVKA